MKGNSAQRITPHHRCSQDSSLPDHRHLSGRVIFSTLRKKPQDGQSPDPRNYNSGREKSKHELTKVSVEWPEPTEPWPTMSLFANYACSFVMQASIGQAQGNISKLQISQSKHNVSNPLWQGINSIIASMSSPSKFSLERGREVFSCLTQFSLAWPANHLISVIYLCGPLLHAWARERHKVLPSSPPPAITFYTHSQPESSVSHPKPCIFAR